MNDPVEANTASDPFLISGFRKRAVHLVSDKPTTIALETDRGGLALGIALTVVLLAIVGAVNFLVGMARRRL